MNTSIQSVHDGITITYNEQENKWEFTLRGRDRSAESLAKAKEIIDKPVPAGKAKPFQKIPAWLTDYGSKPRRIEVTGIAEARWRGDGAWVWINDEGKRNKQKVNFCVFPSNAKNDLLAQKILQKQSTIAQIQEEISCLQKQLDPLVLPKEE